MEINQILEYQKLDGELFKIEKQLRDSPNKKQASLMQENAKNAQQRSMQLEEKAGLLLKEIEAVKAQCKTQEEKMSQIFAKDIENINVEEIEKLLSLKEKLSQNLVILDKNLTRLAENMNAILADFNKTLKSFNLSKEKFNEVKEKYDQEQKLAEPKKQELTKRLNTLASSIEKKYLDTYQKLRKDNIYPIFVRLENNSCGACHMQLPSATIAKIKEEGLLSCEHCRRIIYFTK